MAQYLKVNYCPHPLRNEIWKGKKFVPLIAKDVISYFDKNVRQKSIEESVKIFPSLNIDINVPVLYKYVLKNTKSNDDLFNKALEIRGMKEVKEFRKFCVELEQAYISQDNNKFSKARDLIQEAANDWRESISKPKSTKRITIKDPFGIVSTDLYIPDKILFDSRKRGPLVFIHNLMGVI